MAEIDGHAHKAEISSSGHRVRNLIMDKRERFPWNIYIYTLNFLIRDISFPWAEALLLRSCHVSTNFKPDLQLKDLKSFSVRGNVVTQNGIRNIRYLLCRQKDFPCSFLSAKASTKSEDIWDRDEHPKTATR